MGRKHPRYSDISWASYEEIATLIINPYANLVWTSARKVHNLKTVLINQVEGGYPDCFTYPTSQIVLFILSLHLLRNRLRLDHPRSAL
jgi:hypothetical protein